jgi:mannose-6-phosphate isomerase-like protein (cupin superfamily)
VSEHAAFHVGRLGPLGPVDASASGGVVRERVTIDAAVGCRNLEQRVLDIAPGRTPSARNAASEEVGYVVSGRGRLVAGSETLELRPGCGMLIPPGVDHHLENDGPQDLVVVSVRAPQPGVAEAAREAGRASSTAAAVHEDDEHPLPAGDDRTFKLLIDPRYGARHVTQFVGFIERSRAPMHTHTYEEVIFLLAGSGVVHAGDHRVPISAGSFVYLAPGTPHCLENAGTQTLRLLGVFSPAGSPADKREDAHGS